MRRFGSLGRLALAAGASLTLHGLLGGIARRLAVDESPREAAAETVAVEVLIPPPNPAPLAHGAAAVPAARTRLPRRRHLLSASIAPGPDVPETRTPLMEENSEVSMRTASANVTPLAALPFGAADAEGAGGGEGARGPEGGGARAGPDLGAFVERLRQSALRCAPRRLGPAAEASQARVRFCVDPSGKPQAVTLLQSTGDARLDRAALECVIPGAAPLPATDRCLVVPLRFNL